MLEHSVQRMKQLDGDHDQRLLGRFALGLLAQINGAPLATTAHGIDGGKVERTARNARAHARQAGSRRAVAALVDDRVKADIRDERVIAYSDIQENSYRNIREFHRGDTLTPQLLPECAIAADLLLP